MSSGVLSPAGVRLHLQSSGARGMLPIARSLFCLLGNRSWSERVMCLKTSRRRQVPLWKGGGFSLFSGPGSPFSSEAVPLAASGISMQSPCHLPGLWRCACGTAAPGVGGSGGSCMSVCRQRGEGKIVPLRGVLLPQLLLPVACGQSFSLLFCNISC